MGEEPEARTYICIDLKSYYASVECVARGLDPLAARLWRRPGIARRSTTSLRRRGWRNTSGFPPKSTAST